MAADYNFLMAFDAWIRPYWDAHDAIAELDPGRERILSSDSRKGLLRTTCLGRGLRRDFSEKGAHGYAEYILLRDDLILSLTSIKPKSPMHHRIQRDESLYFGVQIHGAEEIDTVFNSDDNNLMFLGAIGTGRMERILRADETFLAVCLAAPKPSKQPTQVLDVPAPGLIHALEESAEEVDDLSTFFTTYPSGSDLRRCAFEMLHSEFEGEMRLAYLTAKANELICLMESRWQEFGSARTSPSYRLTQEDRSKLEQVRLNVINSPSSDHTIEILARDTGFSVNRLMNLFKSTYGCSIHQFVVESRMDHAKKLLQTTNLSIREVSEHVGYSDLSGFGRAFKKVYGVKPSGMRRQ